MKVGIKKKPPCHTQKVKMGLEGMGNGNPERLRVPSQDLSVLKVTIVTLLGVRLTPPTRRIQYFSRVFLTTVMNHLLKCNTL